MCGMTTPPLPLVSGWRLSQDQENTWHKDVDGGWLTVYHQPDGWNWQVWHEGVPLTTADGIEPSREKAMRAAGIAAKHGV